MQDNRAFLYGDAVFETVKIIGKSSTDFWREKIMEQGGDYLIWSNAPENPMFN